MRTVFGVFAAVTLTLAFFYGLVVYFHHQRDQERCVEGCFGPCLTHDHCQACLDFCKGMPLETAVFLNEG
jgi:hypothetical protein